MKIRKITKIEPEPAKCIEVDHPERLFSVGGQETGEAVLTHNSVVQRNIIFATIMRPDSWRFLGIDLKKVELSMFRAYSNVVLGIATELEDALTVLRFAQQTMMKRYSEMEQLGVNNFLDLPGEKSQALLVMVDELGELISDSGVKALSEHTKLPLPDGNFTTMKKLEINDVILDNYSQPTVVTNKYEPVEQTQYSLTITSDTTKNSENFIAGKEHWWVAIITDANGNQEPEQLITTEELYKFKKEQDQLPETERKTIKFRRKA